MSKAEFGHGLWRSGRQVAIPHEVTFELPPHKYCTLWFLDQPLDDATSLARLTHALFEKLQPNPTEQPSRDAQAKN